MKSLRSQAGRILLGLAAAALAALAFSAWLRPHRAMDWLAVLSFCG